MCKKKKQQQQIAVDPRAKKSFHSQTWAQWVISEAFKQFFRERTLQIIFRRKKNDTLSIKSAINLYEIRNSTISSFQQYVQRTRSLSNEQERFVRRQ